MLGPMENQLWRDNADQMPDYLIRDDAAARGRGPELSRYPLLVFQAKRGGC